MDHPCDYCGKLVPGTENCPHCHEPQPVRVHLEELRNTMQAARWREVTEHGMTVEEVHTDPINDGFLVMSLRSTDADTWGIYPELSVDPGGRVAEYMTNHPYYYYTLGQLLQAAAVRTVAT